MSQATEELASRGRPTLRQEDPRELAKAAERRNWRAQIWATTGETRNPRRA
jgi:hypothetical protein